ncbi:MAG: hypothetical protein ABR985_06765 [Methanotrichaceae archaeon]
MEGWLCRSSCSDTLFFISVTYILWIPARIEWLQRALLRLQRAAPAAYGLAEVGEALKQGRANHLLLSNSFAIPQMICKKCHFHGEGETCPTCGGQMQALSLEERYQQAERTGAEVVLVEDDAFLESIGGIGAM